MFSDESSQSRSFQKGFDFDENRQRRVDDRFSLRKKNRENRLQKRRKIQPQSQSQQDVDTSHVSLTSTHQVTPFSHTQSLQQFQVSDIPHLVKLLKSSSVEDCCLGAHGIRELLCAESKPPNEEVIRGGALPPLIHIMVDGLKGKGNCLVDPTIEQQCILDASWAVSNVASGVSEESECVMKAKGIEAFSYLFMKSRYRNSLQIVENAIWGLANIAGDCVRLRDAVTKIQPVTPILDKIEDILDVLMGKQTPEKNLSRRDYTSFLQQLVWCVSNFVRPKPSPHVWEQCSQIVTTMTRVLHFVLSDFAQNQPNGGLVDEDYNDSYSDAGTPDPVTLQQEHHTLPQVHSQVEGWCENRSEQIKQEELNIVKEVLYDALWSLAYVTDVFDCNETTQNAIAYAIVSNNTVPLLINKVLNTSQMKTVRPIVRCIGQLICFSDEMTDHAVSNGVIECVDTLLCDQQITNWNTRKEICWTLSNITASTSTQHIQKVIDWNLHEKIVELTKCSDPLTRKEAVWALTNACQCATNQQIQELVDSKAIEAFGEFLNEATHHKQILTAIEGLEAIFKSGKALIENGSTSVNIYAQHAEENGILDALEDVQKSDLITETVFDACQELIQTFWGDNDDSENDPSKNTAPQTHENGLSFTFGGGQVSSSSTSGNCVTGGGVQQSQQQGYVGQGGSLGSAGASSTSTSAGGQMFSF